MQHFMAGFYLRIFTAKMVRPPSWKRENSKAFAKRISSCIRADGGTAERSAKHLPLSLFLRGVGQNRKPGINKLFLHKIVLGPRTRLAIFVRSMSSRMRSLSV